jgi:hypothetical protein
VGFGISTGEPPPAGIIQIELKFQTAKLLWSVCCVVVSPFDPNVLTLSPMARVADSAVPMLGWVAEFFWESQKLSVNTPVALPVKPPALLALP